MLQPAGNTTELWVNRYDGPGGSMDWPTGMALDAAGNAYVTGWGYVGSDHQFDYITIKINADGVLQWARTYNGSAYGEY